MATRISAYKTNDGRLFEDPQVAAQHEMLMLVNDVRAVCAKKSNSCLELWLCENATRINVVVGQHKHVIAAEQKAKYPIPMQVNDD